jgi:hypothetical protein
LVQWSQGKFFITRFSTTKVNGWFGIEEGGLCCLKGQRSSLRKCIKSTKTALGIIRGIKYRKSTIRNQSLFPKYFLASMSPKRV